MRKKPGTKVVVDVKTPVAAPIGTTPLSSKGFNANAPLRFDEDGKPSSSGTFDKHGFPLPAQSLPMTANERAVQAQKAAATAAAAAKEKEAQRKAAKRAGFAQ